MKIKIKKGVKNDLEKLTEEAQSATFHQIARLQQAGDFGEMGNIEKMKDTKEPIYRLKYGSYRMMLLKEEGNHVTILAVFHRKDAYKKKQNL